MLMTKQRQHSQGVALITVMLIVALAAIIAAQMTARLQMQLQRTTNILFNQQAYWYAVGAETFGKQVLVTAFKDDKDVTHLGQIWAQGETTYPVDFGEITGEITDAQACLNLNALRVGPTVSGSGSGSGSSSKSGNISAGGSSPDKDDPNKGNANNNSSGTNSGSNKTGKLPARLALEELLIALQLEDVSQFEAESMADALTDWLDKDGAIASAGGAEDNDYASREFPYLTGNHYLASVSELRVIEHFSTSVIQALKPYVCVLPETNLHQININTIDAEKPELLQALLGSTLAQAEAILSAREEDGFEKIDEFYRLPELSKVNITEEQKLQFVVDSEYFTLKTKTSFNNSYFTLNSLLKVATDQQIDVIRRTIGHD